MTGFRIGGFGFFLQRSRQNLVPSMVDVKEMKAKFWRYKAVLNCFSNTHSRQKQTDKCSFTCISIFALILNLIVQTALMSLQNKIASWPKAKLSLTENCSNRKKARIANGLERVWMVWLTVCQADFEQICKPFKRSRSFVSTDEQNCWMDE